MSLHRPAIRFVVLLGSSLTEGPSVKKFDLASRENRGGQEEHQQSKGTLISLVTRVSCPRSTLDELGMDANLSWGSHRRPIYSRTPDR